MTFEELQKTWQSQQNSFKLTIDSDLLLPVPHPDAFGSYDIWQAAFVKCPTHTLT